MDRGVEESDKTLGRTDSFLTEMAVNLRMSFWGDFGYQFVKEPSGSVVARATEGDVMHYDGFKFPWSE